MSRLTIPYAPRYPGIHETLESRRFCVLVAHRRFGKTVLSVNHLIKMALTGALPRSSYAYVCPFRNQAKTVAWAYLKHYTAVIPGREVNESELAIDLPGRGGRLAAGQAFWILPGSWALRCCWPIFRSAFAMPGPLAASWALSLVVRCQGRHGWQARKDLWMRSCFQ